MSLWHQKSKSIMLMILTSVIAMAVGAGAASRPLHVVAIFVLVFLLMIIIKHPANGLYLIVLAIPFDSHSIDVGPLNLSVSNVLIVITAAAWLASQMGRGGGIARDGNNVLVAVTLIGALASTFTAVDAGSHLRSLITLIGCALIYLLAVNLIVNAKTLTRTLWCVGASVLLTALMGIIQAIAAHYWGLSLGIGRVFNYVGDGVALPLPRVTSTWFDPNAYGFFLLTGLPAILYFAARSKEYRPSLVLLASVALFGLFLSYSRGAWFGLAVSMAVLLFLLLRQYTSKKTWPLLAVNAFAAISGFIVIMGGLLRVPIDFLIDLNPAAVHFRLLLWESAIQDFVEQPLMGLGFDGYFLRHGWYVHNSFVEVLLALGIVGALPFYILIVRTTMMGLKSRDDIVVAMAASLVGLAVAGAFISVMLLKNLWLVMGVIVAAVKIYERARQLR